jgi:hypothetical protein
LDEKEIGKLRLCKGAKGAKQENKKICWDSLTIESSGAKK